MKEENHKVTFRPQALAALSFDSGFCPVVYELMSGYGSIAPVSLKLVVIGSAAPQ